MTIENNLDILQETDDKLRINNSKIYPTDQQLSSIKIELATTYDYYINNISEYGHPVSLETASYLLFLCRTQEAKQVVDLGSGFSSYVLEHYKNTAPYPVTAHHIDTDMEWAERTVAFGNIYGIDMRVQEFSDFVEIKNESFDIVFHDMANGEIRNQTMPFACSLLTSKGIIVFDDCQHDGHRQTSQDVCANLGLEWISLHNQTIDKINRFAAIGVKK
jgi:predicted O-methyltransferase YrrM